ncbi:hypothetical protein G7046_g7656 [Stylonectria norvegica]|nr:hypothetical protein G7046_g7656 [Stylonectria norvegica]
MNSTKQPQLTQYVAFVDPNTNLPRIGHFDLEAKSIQPLSFTSGTPVANLYQVIEAGPAKIVAVGDPIPSSSTKVLPPINRRDVLAVGKNYSEHAKEFNSSGFDSSDKVDIPSHPVIFTKRATSIIADGEDILPHSNFSKTIDYEGEIGVIIGRSGFRVEEKDAWDYVWGYTIINDMTARERQRDHKQFSIGKSPDTFCPMGPIAVPKEHLPPTLRVQTHVNGELRQDATSDDLIFSIPTLIRTISEVQTIRPGDVIATGTPAGVGIGKTPPVYLRSGDQIAVSITGLGTLSSRIAPSTVSNYTTSQVAAMSSFQLNNAEKSLGAGAGLTQINSKPLHYRKLGKGERNIVFVHGLGGTSEIWTPFIATFDLEQSHTLHVFDLEGHGLSPTHPLSEITIESLAADIRGVLDHAQTTPDNRATLIAHGMGCLAALRCALDNPPLVGSMILFAPPPLPDCEASSQALYAQAALVRAQGMSCVVNEVADSAMSRHSRMHNPMAVTAARLSVLGQDPEGYAKACWALAKATEGIPVENIDVNVLIITGDKDKVSPPELCVNYKASIVHSQLAVLKDVGHWHTFEELKWPQDARTFISYAL